MKDKELYERLLGLTAPWKVESVSLDIEKSEVEVRVVFNDLTVWSSADGRRMHLHGREERRWRELDSVGMRTVIIAEVPRLKDPQTGKVQTAVVPWASRGSRFTYGFECLAIRVLLACPTVERARVLLGLDWRQVNAIRTRAVELGMARREGDTEVEHLGLDEKSFLKGQSYVSILTDLKGGRVLEVVEGRDESAAKKLLNTLTDFQKQSVRAIALDMWPAFMKAVQDLLRLAFMVHDRFHIAKYLSEAIDKIRRSECAALAEQGDDQLKRTRWLWLKRSHNPEEEAAFKALEKDNLDVARAWHLRELFDKFWDFRDTENAEAFLNGWNERVQESGLAPMKKVAKMIMKHLEGVLGYCLFPITNAASEGFNSKIQAIKSAARGFKSFPAYRVAILFHCGKLQLFPHHS